MDIDQLRSFDRVVRDGSFTKAAARLNVTQATISARIAKLEELVGGPLLTRGRRIELTERGATFLPYARRVLSTLVESEDALRSVDRGRIGLATLRSVTGYLTAPSVVAFLTDHPQVELTVEEGRHRDVAEWLHDRQIDLAVIGWPNFDPLLDTIEPLALFREPALLVASAELAARIGPEPTLERVFAIAPHFLTHFWWQVTPEAILAMRRHARTASHVPFEPGRLLIAGGHAVGHLLGPSIRAELAAGDLVDLAPVDMPPLYRDSALVAGVAGAMERPLVAELASRLVETAASLRILHADRR